MTTAVVAAPPTRSGWIVSRPFDLLWFFGGAAASLGVLGLYAAGVPIVLLFWAWLLLSDGPHLYATISRTYLDREEWRRRPRLLGWSLLMILSGAPFLALNVATGSEAPFLAFLALAMLYGFVHLVRQHYGFLSLYRSAGGEPFRKLDFHLDKWCLYVGCWAPYFYFLFTAPVAQLAGVPATPAPWDTLLGGVSAAIYAGALLVFLGRSWQRRAEVSRTKVAYTLSILLLYGVVYGGIARLEPVYPDPQTPDQALLLLSIMIALTHGVQYLGLVWFHNRNRYAEEGRDYGPARRLSGTLPGFLTCCALYSLIVYLGLGALTGTFPAIQVLTDASLGPITFNQIGLALWWGISVHHYLVDQYIWRVKGDEELRRHLGLA